MKELINYYIHVRVFLIPLDRMLVHHRVTPSNNFSNSHLYTWAESDTVRVECLAQEHDVKDLPQLLPRPLDLARDQRSNPEATAPLTTGFMVVHYVQVDLKRKGHATSLYSSLE